MELVLLSQVPTTTDLLLMSTPTPAAPLVTLNLSYNLSGDSAKSRTRILKLAAGAYLSRTVLCCMPEAIEGCEQVDWSNIMDPGSHPGRGATIC